MKFTFENILNASLNIASCLKYEYGIQKSDIVGVFSENTIWYPSVILAIWHIGAICTLLNPMYTFSEFNKLLLLFICILYTCVARGAKISLILD